MFPDGRQLILLSMEPRRDGPGRPFEEYYTQTPTHIWQYDLKTGGLEELCTRERQAVFITPALLLDDGRMLIQVVKDGVGQIYNVFLDGSDPQEFTQAGEGMPYGLSLSPDGSRVAFHLASPAGYQVWTSDLNGRDRQLIAARSRGISISVRAGRQMDAGSCMSIATTGTIRDTTGQTSASAKRMAPSIEC